MKSIKIIINTFLLISLTLVTSCSDITEINENPNGVDPTQVQPALLMSTVMSEAGKEILETGFGQHLSVTMQYTVIDSWGDNNYEGMSSVSWDKSFDILRNANLAYKRAEDLNSDFYMGISLVMKAQMFGLLADFYGDVPYSEALQGDDVENPIIKPVYDPQEAVYKGIIKDLLKASELLSKDATYYKDINQAQDLYYNGDPNKWMRYANSLALRYYMRLSEKDPVTAENGVKAMLKKPLILTNDQSCTLEFVGVSSEDSWPWNGITSNYDEYTRIRPCTTLTNKLKELDDPRIHEWFDPVERQIRVVPAAEMPGPGDDIIVDDVRYIKEESLAPNGLKVYDPLTWYNDRENNLTMVDTSHVYVGIPPANQDTDPYNYNLNPQPERGGNNIHVSLLDAQFNETSGDNLVARIFPAAEIHFLLAEAALRGWGSDAEVHYYDGIRASFADWDISNKYDDYIDNPGVVYNGTLRQIIEQKWISNFAVAVESYMDWRRTGFPEFTTGPYAKSSVIPVRAIYPDSDKNINLDNYLKAVGNLEVTEHTDDVPGNDGADSHWSKNWAQQGVSKPWN